MSDCKDKKCKDCNEDYLQGMLPCVTLPELCVDGETCDETYNAKCVRYTGAAVVCGSTTVLANGMTTHEALISLANAICLSGGGGLIDLTPLEQCCATNTSNITNLQTNLSIVNNTLTTVSTQITTINTTLGTIDTQITALQECCDASVKKCAPFDPSYAVISCLNGEDVFASDMFYIDKMNAGMSPITFSQTSSGYAGKRLPLGATETASAFFVEAGWTTFGLSWRYPVENEYYKSIQAIYGGMPIPQDQTYLLTKNVSEIIGVQGCAGLNTFNNNHINSSNEPILPLLMTSIGVQGVASKSTITNIGGDFLSLWRGFQTSPNTAIRGKASGSNLNSGYDIEVGLTTDANRANVGGKIVVKSGAGGTNHGLKIDVSQALGVTYAIQLKDTTAAAGKFLKAIDSDGNAIWDTVTAGSVPPGVVSNNNINGTPNYVTKWTAADQIGDSLLRDDGTSMAVGSAPSANSLFTINATNHWFALDVNNSSNRPGSSNYGIDCLVNGTSLVNTGVQGWATGATNTNVGGYFTGRGGTSLKNYGIHAVAANGPLNYAARLVDGTETVVGRYLRNMTTNGEANWANINITEVTNGLSSTLLGAPNGIATLDSNSKLLISQLPITVMDYRGTYDIVTNVPVLVDGTGNQGDVYVNTAVGTRTFGPGNTITVAVGDWLIYNGTKWEKTLGNNVGAGTVTSVGLTVGTTGTDINVANTPITSTGNIAINIPTASATARGVLSIADWNTFSGKVSAPSGTDNYIAKFTPNGTTIGNSLIRDNGTAVGVNMAPNANAMFFVTGGTQTNAIAAQVNVNNGTAIYGQAFTGAGTLYGVTGYANSSTATNNIGLYGKAVNAVSNYPIQLEESTSSTGKFLKSITSDGKANWNYLPDSAQIMCSDMTSVITADAGTPKAIWAAPCAGQLTDAFASLRTPQTGGAVFTVLVKTGSTTVATITFTNGTVQWMSINPAVTTTFAKGDIFQLYVSQVGDGTARSLLVTLNYLRT